MDTTNRLRAGPTLAHAWRSLNANRGMAALGVGALVIAAIVPFWPLKVAVLAFAQFELTWQSLAEDRLLPESARRRVLAVIGVQLIVWLTVMLGFTVLVLPGVYLWLRFSLAVPALIAGDASVLEAIAISWRRTARQELVLLGIAAMAIAPAAALWVAMMVAAGNDMGLVAVALTGIAALVITALTFVFGWFVAAAAYAESGAGSAWLEDVFA